MLRTLKTFDVAAFAARYKAQIDAISTSLACNFDVPAQATINRGFAEMGESRFVGKDDRWEQVTAHLNGWGYTPPAKHLMRRWACY